VIVPCCRLHLPCYRLGIPCYRLGIPINLQLHGVHLQYVFLIKSLYPTHGHTRLRIGDRVRSRIHKRSRDHLVIGWVTNSESLIAVCFFCLFFCFWRETSTCENCKGSSHQVTAGTFLVSLLLLNVALWELYFTEHNLTVCLLGIVPGIPKHRSKPSVSLALMLQHALYSEHHPPRLHLPLPIFRYAYPFRPFADYDA